MSCIQFGSPTHTRLDAARKQSFLYLSPKRTQSKVRRLHSLSRSPKESDRIAAAGNPMTERADLVTLACDASPRVRGWVLRNPAAPLALVESLRGDGDKSVAAYAAFLASRG